MEDEKVSLDVTTLAYCGLVYFGRLAATENFGETAVATVTAFRARFSFINLPLESLPVDFLSAGVSF